MTTIPTEIIDRVIGYIQHNATKTPQELHTLVEQGHDHLSGLIDAFSEEQARWKPGNEWCALELLHHVVSAKRGVARICQRLATGEQIPGAGREGDEQDGITRGDPFASLAEARRALDAAHEDLLAFIDGPLANANVETRFRHFLFGELNCREWATFQRVHDGDHSGQIEKITSAPGYPVS